MQEEISPWANFFPICVGAAFAEALSAGVVVTASRAARGAEKSDEMGTRCANRHMVDSGAKQSYTAERCHIC